MNARLIYLLLFLCSCSSTQVWEYPSFEGVVVSEKGQPLNGVNIQLEDHRTKTVLDVARSAEDGKFSVMPRSHNSNFMLGDPGMKGKYIFRKDGFEPREIAYQFFGMDVVGKTPPKLIMPGNGHIKLKKNLLL